MESAVPGGVKLIRLDSGGDTPPYVESDGHRALVVQEGAAWVAVVGIPLAAPLGPRAVTVRGAGGRSEIEFTVGEKRYASQSLKVAPRQVNLSRRRSGSGQPRARTRRAGHQPLERAAAGVRCAGRRPCPGVR